MKTTLLLLAISGLAACGGPKLDDDRCSDMRGWSSLCADHGDVSHAVAGDVGEFCTTHEGHALTREDEADLQVIRGLEERQSRPYATCAQIPDRLAALKARW